MHISVLCIQTAGNGRPTFWAHEAKERVAGMRRRFSVMKLLLKEAAMNGPHVTLHTICKSLRNSFGSSMNFDTSWQAQNYVSSKYNEVENDIIISNIAKLASQLMAGKYKFSIHFITFHKSGKILLIGN